MCPFLTQKRIGREEQFPRSLFLISIRPRNGPCFFSPWSLRSASSGTALAAVLLVKPLSEALQSSSVWIPLSFGHVLLARACPLGLP